MFGQWNIIDNGITNAGEGHHFWEATALAEELAGRGSAPRIFCHRDAPVSTFSGAELMPIFSLAAHMSVSSDPTWSAIENFVVFNRSFHGDLSRVDPALFHRSSVFLPTCGRNELLGLIRWLGGFPDALRPKTAACLVPPRDWSPQSQTVQMYKRIWADCPSGLKNGITLFSRSEHNARFFEQLLGVKPRFFPFPFGRPREIRRKLEALPQASGAVMTVAFVAQARRERGGGLIPQVVRECAALDVDFFIQAKGGFDIDVGSLTALRDLPRVTIYEGRLERDDYCDVLAKCVVLIPYAAANYRWRSSGVYNEAKFIGAPVIVPAGTLMEDEVRARGTGVVMTEFSVEALVRCIGEARGRLPALQSAASSLGKAYREQNGVDRCIDAIANAFAGMEGGMGT